jgi:hypothetical protein
VQALASDRVDGDAWYTANEICVMLATPTIKRRPFQSSCNMYLWSYCEH